MFSSYEAALESGRITEDDFRLFSQAASAFSIPGAEQGGLLLVPSDAAFEDFFQATNLNQELVMAAAPLLDNFFDTVLAVSVDGGAKQTHLS